MNNKIPRVLDFIVKNDICIGCGVCVYACKTQALSMQWNNYGFIVPFRSGNCNEDGNCLKGCPFNPYPEDGVKTEDELSDNFLKDPKFAVQKIGRYLGIYAGYSHDFRLTSSSGGIATYFLSELLSNGIVNYVFSVSSSEKPGFHYEYLVIKSKQELLASSKTKYYPVTLATVLAEIDQLDGKIAIVGVGCFVKAIRLLQYYNPALREKIHFLVGIICGGVKSRFFTEYLSEKSSVSKMQTLKPEYRIKDLNSTANDYSFRCQNKSTNEIREVKMRSVGNMWGTGLFKANACDFCDDVTTELADISLGDAWLTPFWNDGRGTNIIITRSCLSDNIIQEGLKSGKLIIENLSMDELLQSQQGSFNHRHKGLYFRIQKALQQKIPIPFKRFSQEKPTFEFRAVQKGRMTVRQKSLEIWRNCSNANDFDKKMRRFLWKLSLTTRIYHLIDSIRIHLR